MVQDDNLRILRDFVRGCDEVPGIYKMLDADGVVLYIGKAKNLKSRLSDYLQLNSLSDKTRAILSRLRSIETITTNSEFEAILLESNLIKKNKPKYNILLKDDKSFPYICIDELSSYPRIIKYRGKKKDGYSCWGPFASASKIDEVIDILQKSFLLRTCSDHFFASRKRPCIIYQMKRCSAPCVNKISKNDYASLVGQAKDYLKGKNDALYSSLTKQMKLASENFEYEKASIYRDRLAALDSIRSKQLVQLDDDRDFDVVVAETKDDIAAIEVFFIRDGINLGNKVYYFEGSSLFSAEEVLVEFLYSFYAKNEPPKEILINVGVEDVISFVDFIKGSYNVKTKLNVPIRGVKKELVDFALNNLGINLKKKIASLINHKKQLDELSNFFSTKKIERIEIYDNSHFAGDQQVGVMVVSGRTGFNKNEYRKYNIVTPLSKGDDYGMLREVFERRFKNNSSTLPDLIIIDGGYGQLSVAYKVLESFKLCIPIIGMAKGQNRNSGEETIYLPDGEIIVLDKHSKLKHYLQLLRDEAHRFAITANRKKMESRLQSDIFKRIPGIGDKTQKLLLNHFGSLAKMKLASLEEFYAVRGLSKKNAQNLYQYFHTTL